MPYRFVNKGPKSAYGIFISSIFHVSVCIEAANIAVVKFLIIVLTLCIVRAVNPIKQTNRCRYRVQWNIA